MEHDTNGMSEGDFAQVKDRATNYAEKVETNLNKVDGIDVTCTSRPRQHGDKLTTEYRLRIDGLSEEQVAEVAQTLDKE